MTRRGLLRAGLGALAATLGLRRKMPRARVSIADPFLAAFAIGGLPETIQQVVAEAARLQRDAQFKECKRVNALLAKIHADESTQRFRGRLA